LDATVVAIDMAISDDVKPPSPVGVVVTDAEVLLVASGSDRGCLTKFSTDEIGSAAVPRPRTIIDEVMRSSPETTAVLARDFGPLSVR
jgi:hypothetical protein